MNHLQKLHEALKLNNNLQGKLFSLLESAATFDENFKITSVLCFIPNFNLLSCELQNFTFEVLCLLYIIIYCYHLIMIFSNRDNLVNNQFCNHLLG